MLLDVVEEAVEAGVELRLGIEAGIGPQHLGELSLPALDRGDDEVLLGRKVVVEQAFRDPRGLGDLLDRDFLVRPHPEQLDAGAEQLLAPIVGAHPDPQRLGHGPPRYSLLT